MRPSSDSQTPLLATENRSDNDAGSPNGAAAASTSGDPKAAAGDSKSNQQGASSSQSFPKKAGTDISWGTPAGLHPRGPNDENLVIFRKALGINFDLPCGDGATVEEGRKTATGIYRMVVDNRKKKHLYSDLVAALMYLCYFAQIVIGAALTALGPSASRHPAGITLLGAVNTVLAGVLAMIKGSGQPQRLAKDWIEYRKLQDWIEETESLLAVGVVGRNRREVGILVESAFKKYNAVKATEENNREDMYATMPPESLGNRASDELRRPSMDGGKGVADGYPPTS